MQVPDKILTPTIQKALSGEKYDHLKVRQIGGFLKEGDRLMELGAGIGFISAFASSKIKPDTCVLIEANPELISVIKKTHELNGSNPIIINAVALSSSSVSWNQVNATTNEIPFYVIRNFWGSSLTAKSEAVSVVHVPVLSLNDLIREHRPTVLICDIEGGELDVFENVDLHGVRTVFLDVHESIIGQKGIHRLKQVMAEQGLHYDPNNSIGAAIIFTCQGIEK
jgi:FkbM family methyltransferase